MKKIWLAAVLLLALGGCYNDKYDKLYPAPAVVTCDTTGITYSADIKPIIIANCYSPGNGCHDAAGSAASGYNFESTILPLQGTGVNNRLVGSINGHTGFSAMPKGRPKLSDCDIAKITIWVNMGVPDN